MAQGDVGSAVRVGERAAARLARLRCCAIEPGLSDSEFERIESSYGFEFADDHRAFLAAGLPVRGIGAEAGAGRDPWPNWRDGSEADLRARLDRPIAAALAEVAAIWTRGSAASSPASGSPSTGNRK
ncbi:hypothetical protein [Nocardia asteroides]|uniref:hypothetical protein n=1 Tax=Nocardia asteroides TaxID=1824 RepID=UPI001E51CD18|nr:hypothetical protein [Nocardia asteroides]UGT59454.1 hypothetical protein LTT61_19570 [Nocardia asteroides]